jgi:hypothetical protein
VTIANAFGERKRKAQKTLKKRAFFAVGVEMTAKNAPFLPATIQVSALPTHPAGECRPIAPLFAGTHVLAETPKS